MTVAFPPIQPTGCSFTPPTWSITESVAQSGVRSYRIWSSKPVDALLDLAYNNITESQAEAITQTYLDAKGPITDLSVPALVFSGITSTTFRNIFSQEGTGLLWYFAQGQPPVMERVPGRRYSTRVSLRAELRF
jgi:hypothetical protein